MANENKKYRLKGSKSLPPGSFVNIQVAGVGKLGKIKDDVTGEIKEGVIHCFTRLEPGQEIQADVIEHPDRLEAAISRGHLAVTTIGK